MKRLDKFLVVAIAMSILLFVVSAICVKYECEHINSVEVESSE